MQYKIIRDSDGIAVEVHVQLLDGRVAIAPIADNIVGTSESIPHDVRVAVEQELVGG